MCTNRLGALDPAVKRRAADILIIRTPGRRRSGTRCFCRALSAARLLVGADRQHRCGDRCAERPHLRLHLFRPDAAALPAIVLDAYPADAGPILHGRSKCAADMLPRLRSRRAAHMTLVASEASRRPARRHSAAPGDRPRQSFGHPGTKGDASERVWLEMLQNLSCRSATRRPTAHVVDSKGVFSDQIDVVVFDRQYSPFIFQLRGPDDHSRPRASMPCSRPSSRINAEPGRVCAEEGRERAPPSSDQPADPLRARDLPAEAADPDPRRHSDFRKRLESALRRAAAKTR